MFLFLGECCIWAFWLWVFLGGGCSGNCSSRDHQAGHSRRLRSYLGGASGSESVCLGPWVPGIYPEMVLILLIPMLYNCVHLPCLQGIEGRVALWSGWHNPGTSTPALGIFPQAFPPPGGGPSVDSFLFWLMCSACLSWGGHSPKLGAGIQASGPGPSPATSPAEDGRICSPHPPLGRRGLGCSLAGSLKSYPWHFIAHEYTQMWPWWALMGAPLPN